MSSRVLRVAGGALPLLAAVWVLAAEGVALAPWVAVVTAATVTLLAARSLHGGVRPAEPVLWLAGLGVWVMASAALLPVPRAQGAWLAAVAVVAVGLALAGATPAGARWCRAAVLAAGAMCAGWLLVERLLEGGRPGGPLDDPNRAATVAVLALALVVTARMAAAPRVAVAVLLVAGITASMSRAALLATAAVVLVWVAGRTARAWRLTLLALAALALTALAARLLADPDPLRFERLKIWGVALRTAVAELPLGAGPGGFRDAAIAHNFPRAGEVARYHRLPGLAENDPLQLAASLGIPGVVLGLGLLAALARRLRRRLDLAAVLVALGVTSAFHSQLWVPLVAWSATMAVAATLPRGHPPRVRLAVGVLVAAALVVIAPLAASLSWPRGGLAEEAGPLLARAVQALVAGPPEEERLATAEAQAWRATRLRPRSAAARRRLADLRLQRAVLVGDSRLVADAAASYGEAARRNPLDVWAALGEGRARAVLGQREAAGRLLRTALVLEPNCVPAWLELARLELEGGRIDAARRALRHAEAAIDRARATVPVSDYERALAIPDRGLLLRLRQALERAP